MSAPVMSEPVVIVLIVVAGLIIGLAIWVGRGLVVRKDKKGLFLEVKEKGEEHPTKGTTIKVAEKLQLTDVTAGDIGGKIIKGGNDGATETNSIEVARESTIKKSTIGNIFGIEIDQQRSE